MGRRMQNLWSDVLSFSPATDADAKSETLDKATLSACLHSWRESELGRRHLCSGRVACHDAPCVCRCGAEDWCTANPTQGQDASRRLSSHDPRRPSAREGAR